MLRLLTTPGFPPTRTGLRAAVRPCARPRSSPSGLFATAPRFSESTQRACIGGAPFMCHKRHAPYVPPAESKCLHRFPASLTRRCGNSFGGLRPAADRVTAVPRTQLAAWRGVRSGTGCSDSGKSAGLRRQLSGAQGRRLGGSHDGLWPGATKVANLLRPHGAPDREWPWEWCV